jgi:serine protease AprX
VIVMAADGGTAGARDRVAALGGRVTRDLPLVGGFAATVPGTAAAALARDPEVRSLTPDESVGVNATPLTADAETTSEPTSVYPYALGADRVWQAGHRGQGVTVAVIDTGVSQHADLAGRLVSVRNDTTGRTAPCMNLSGEPSCDDSYGHGTFIAGVIAGDGATDGGASSGVAPSAKILSVKVAGGSGATDVSNILAAIQWVVSFKSRYGIRVLNLSLSTDSTQTYRPDPFNYAVERAWDAGIAVVVSASNRGPTGTTISKPGDDPLVITVGAVDDRGSTDVADDEVPDFTSRGPTPADGLAKPDVVAPGVLVRSLRVEGSTVALNSTALPGPYIRGSGTSFASAAVSGVVALMLSRTPGLTPNQVKHAVVTSARALPATSDRLVVGAGEVDAATAALDPPAGSANAGVVRSNGRGSLQASRGHVETQTLTTPTVVVNGTLTVLLLAWDPTGFLLPWSTASWYISTWALTPLLAVTWSDDDWPGRNWGGRNWGGGDWAGSTFEGAVRSGAYGSPIAGAIWLGAWG